MPRTKRSGKKVTEHEETDERVLQEKVSKLAQLIRNSTHCVVHTGADFRGPTGVWTLKDQGLQPNIDIEFEEALPTYSHMALVELMKRGLVKYIISQNVDGLHLRSGIPRENLSELHGNVYLEKCNRCGKGYLRDFDAAQDADDKHLTGRKCEELGCAGKLMDSIIDFGEDLPEDDLNRAIEHSKKADLAIALGSSLQVTPASELPRHTLNNAKSIVIVNLQPTDYDSECEIRFFAKIDRVMQMLMRELQIEVPVYMFPSKKILVGNTTERLVDDDDAGDDRPRKRGRHRRGAPNEKQKLRITIFLSGEFGYLCPLVQKSEVSVADPAGGDISSITAVAALACRNGAGELTFAAKTQGDLFYFDLELPSQKKSAKISEDAGPAQHEGHAAPVVQIKIFFKEYCNTIPALIMLPIETKLGMHESVYQVNFTPPDRAHPNNNPPSAVVSFISTNTIDIE